MILAPSGAVRHQPIQHSRAGNGQISAENIQGEAHSGRRRTKRTNPRADAAPSQQQIVSRTVTGQTANHVGMRSRSVATNTVTSGGRDRRALRARLIRSRLWISQQREPPSSETHCLPDVSFSGFLSVAVYPPCLGPRHSFRHPVSLPTATACQLLRGQKQAVLSRRSNTAKRNAE